MNPLIQLKSAAPVFVVALVCVGLLPTAKAVVPAPDGGYPGGNTAEGQSALLNLTNGGFNTAVGFFSLRSNTTGQLNTAIGAGTLLANTADQNTATGAAALLNNTIGAQNTANGAFALFHNTGGGGNTADGVQALFFNTTGNANTATGDSALFFNTTGLQNTAIGGSALLNNTTGNLNTAIGLGALFQSDGGNSNIALGASAGDQVTTASNVICIGASGANLGNSCYVGQIFGQPVDPATAVPVFVDTNGKLGTAFSSRRFKHDIKPMDDASKAILALKPVSFHYKSDAKSTPQYGLIAEEVAEVNPDLVVRDKNGELLTVRYEAVNAMLVNEFLKEHRTVQELKSAVAKQEAIIAKQQKDFQATAAHQQKQIAALTAGLQKVSAQLEGGKPAPQVVNNP